MKKVICAVALAFASFANPVDAAVQLPTGEGVPFPEVELPAFPTDLTTRPVKKSGPSAMQKALLKAAPEGQLLVGYQCESVYGIPMGFYRMYEWGGMEFMYADQYTAKGYEIKQGWMRNGRLSAIADYTIFSTVDYRYLEMDPFTGEVFENVKINLSDPVTTFPNYLPLYFSSAYDPSADRVYGYTCSENGQGYAFYSAPGNDPNKTVEVKNSPYQEVCVSVAFNTDDGYVYGINRNNDVVKISPSTGEQTVIVATGLRTVYAPAGMIYMPERKKFLWVLILIDNTYGLAEIDPEAKTVTQIGKFDDVESMSFIFTLDAAADPNPIKAPELDEVKFDHVKCGGTISYFTPTEYFIGGTVSGEMQWYATLDGEEYKNGVTTAGNIVDVEYSDLERGEHTFGFYVKHNGKGSAVNTQSLYVGYDVPNKPENVVLTSNRIEWDHVTRCVNGGYLDPESLVYHVYINDDEVGVTHDNYLDYDLPEDAPYAAYYAYVIADNKGQLSSGGMSDKLRFGKPWELDVVILPTAADAAVCSAFDLNFDKFTWGFTDKGDDASYFAPSSINSSDCNDWLFMPPMNFDDADAAYEVTYDVMSTSSTYSDINLTVTLHPELDPRVVETVIQENTKYSKTPDFVTYSQTFAVSAPGTYYISLFTANPRFHSGLRVRNIRVKKLTSGTDLPQSVSNLVANGAPKGELKAIVEFDLPAKYISGADIPETETIKVSVVSAGETVEVSGKPGEHKSVEVAAEQGTNRVVVVTAIGDKKGKQAHIDVYAGFDVPAGVSTMTGHMSADNLTMTVSWTKPSEVGENGHYVDPDDVEYFVMMNNEGNWEVYEELGKNVFEYTYSVEPGSPLATVYVGIVPGTVAGRSNNVNWMSDAMGTPYTLPIYEPFENARFKYGPIRIIRLNDEYVDSEWGVVNPRLIDPTMDVESEMAAYGRSEGPSKRGMLMLPKVDLENVEDPGIVFNFWTGTGAADVTIYGETFDCDDFIEIGKVPVNTQGWQVLNFPFPDSMKNHKWVAIYVDAYFENASRYAMFSSYEIRGGVTAGISSVTAADGGWLRGGYGEIVASGLDGKMIEVHALDGRLVAAQAVDADEVSIQVEAGVYVVRAGQTTVKVLVR